MKIEASQILLQIVNFAILLFVLTKFLYRPLLKIMENRSKKIQEGLEAAEKSLEEQAKAQEKKMHIITAAEKKATVLLDEARRDAQRASKDIIAAARKEARESGEKEYKILKGKIQEEENRVRQNIASLVTKTTESVLEQSLTPKAHKQIIKKQIKQLGSLKN